MARARIAKIALGLALLVAAAGTAPHAPSALEREDWSLYRHLFIAPEGRVVDTGNGGISHSEGQGYGMLFATAFGDRDTFDRLWRWTRTRLQIRDDRLFAWKWDPDARPDPVPDMTSAADGDLLIAWALARAGHLWREPHYLDAARGIAADILERLVRESAHGPVLLPGTSGFVHDGVATVNPSYWVFPAFWELDAVLPSPRWRELAATGVELLEAARFGRFGLPPDWLRLGQPLRPSPLFAPEFGYNAIRVPLHLVWGGIDDPALLGPFVRLAAAYDHRPPATLDLEADTPGPAPVSRGAAAVLALAEEAAGGRAAELPHLDERMDYFAASLLLLARIAYAERFES